MLVAAKEIRDLYQGGKEGPLFDAIKECWPQIDAAMRAAIAEGDDRTVTFSAPQIWALAERLHGLRGVT